MAPGVTDEAPDFPSFRPRSTPARPLSSFPAKQPTASPPPSVPPSLSIGGPAQGAAVSVVATLIGSASDPQDGNLTGSIQWTSSREGFLGSGSPLAVTFSRLGQHRITPKVTDSSGTAMVKSIDIVVSDTTLPQRFVDTPAHNQQVSGNVSVVGWALDHSGVPNPPTFEVDGQTVTVANLQLPGQAASSFTSLNLTSMFPAGGGLVTIGTGPPISRATTS